MNGFETFGRGLIVSCQAHDDHPLRDPLMISAMAACAERGGAVGIRADGAEDVEAVREKVSLPIVGIRKVVCAGDRPFITPTFEHAREVVEAGADVVALEAARENRTHDEVSELIRGVRKKLGVPVMADVSTFREGLGAWEAGAELVATTLSGYTPQSPRREGPDLDLVRELANVGIRVVAEGHVRTPEQLGELFDCGAYAVVVGTAITDPISITSWFVGATPESGRVSLLCVDGGQTKTAVCLFEEDGTLLHTWEDGPLPTPSRPGGVERFREVVRGVCLGLRRRLGPRPPDFPEAACFSMTGYLEGDERVPALVREELGAVVPEIWRVRIVPDYVGNWAAATRGEPGIVVISGGGTVVFGRSPEGRSIRIGGWGHLLGDEGSGYWIGLSAIKAALRSRAGVDAKTALEEGVMRAFDVSDDRGLVREVYSGSSSDARIAGLMPWVVSLAREGDVRAAGILDEAADHLAEMAATALAGLGGVPVYLSGGVFGAPTMQQRFEASLKMTGTKTTVTAVSPNPMEGILLIAKEDVA